MCKTAAKYGYLVIISFCKLYVCINGGIMKRTGAISGPVVTITVADIDKALQKVVKAGGKVMVEKQKVMGIGWNAYAIDTEGNVMGIWQSTRQMQACYLSAPRICSVLFSLF